MKRTLLTAAASVAAHVGLLLFPGEQAAEAPRPGTNPYAFTDAWEAAGLFTDAAKIWSHGPVAIGRGLIDAVDVTDARKHG